MNPARFPLVLACLASVAGAQNRAVLADVEVEGPLSEVVFDLGPAGSTRLVGELVAGEVRRLVVPLAPRSDAERSAPVIHVLPEPDALAQDLEPRGRARFLGWRSGASPLDELSVGLRNRPRPAVSESAASLARSTPFALLAAGIVVLALRRRPALALAASVAASAALALLVHRPESDASNAVVLVDGDADEPRWRRVDAAFARIEVPEESGAPGISAGPRGPVAIGSFELWVDPAGVPVHWRVPLSAGARASAAASRARLFLASTVPGGAALLGRAANHAAALQRAWLREAGTWSARGAWPLSTPLPPPLAGDPAGDAPPGWLASGLPQGVAVLVGRCAGSGSAWLRVSGL